MPSSATSARHSLAFLTTTDRIQDHPGGVLGPVWRGLGPGPRVFWLPSSSKEYGTLWAPCLARMTTVWASCSGGSARRSNGAIAPKSAAGHSACSATCRAPVWRGRPAPSAARCRCGQHLPTPHFRLAETIVARSPSRTVLGECSSPSPGRP